MTSTTVTVNTVTGKNLSTAQTTSSLSVIVNAYDGNIVVAQYYMAKIWKVSSGGSETLLGTSSIDSGGTNKVMTTTWSCTGYSLARTDAIIVRVLADDFSPPTTLRQTFITTQLDGQSLDSSTWTFYMNSVRLYAGGLTTYRFYYGSSTYNGRVTNFAWTPFTGTLNFYGTITQTFTIAKQKEVSFNRAAFITQTFSISSQKFIERILNLFGSITQTFGIQSTFQYTTVTENIINLFGSIIQTFSLGSEILGLPSGASLSFLIFVPVIMISGIIILIYGIKRKG